MMTYNFARMVANGAEPDLAPRGVATLYSVLDGGKATSGISYVNLIAIAMTSWDRQGGWPYRMSGLGNPDYRIKTLEHIEELIEEGSEWAQIARLAKMILLALEDEQERAVSVAKGLNDESPILGHFAKRYLRGVVNNRKLTWTAEPIQDMFPTPNMKTMKPIEEFYKQFKKNSVFTQDFLRGKGIFLNGLGYHRVVNDFRSIIYAACVPNHKALGSIGYDYRVTLREFNPWSITSFTMRT